MNGRQVTRRYVAVVDGEEVAVELNVGEGGHARYSIDGVEGEVEYTVAHGGEAVLLRDGASPMAARIVRDGDAVEAIEREHSLRFSLYPEARFLVGRMQGLLGAGQGVVETGMPGRVVRVLVSEGDEVETGDGLVILEAMKMENEVRAPRSGRVVRVAVVEGQNVEAGALLVEIGDA